MQILPRIGKKNNLLLSKWSCTAAYMTGKKLKQSPHLQVPDNNDDGDKWRWKQTYPGLASLSTLGAVCDSKPTSKHIQAHSQNPSCLIEGGDAEPFNMSTQIRPDATAVWSRSER